MNRWPFLFGFLFLFSASGVLGLTTIYQSNFSSSCNGWVSGTCDTSHAVYNVSGPGIITSPSLNASNFTTIIESWRSYSTVNTTWRWRMLETASSATNDDVYCDLGGTLQRCRLEPEFTGNCNVFDFGQWVNYTRNVTRINNTASTVVFNATNGTTSCGWTMTANTNWTLNSDRNYTRIEAVTVPSGGYLSIASYSAVVRDDEYNNSKPGPTNGTSTIYPLLNASSASDFGLANRSADYDELVQGLQVSGNVTELLGNDLYVPWYGTSSSCTPNDLQTGNNCNIGMSVDASHNCMVNDEFSQVGIIVSMGTNSTLMSQAYNTMIDTRSTHGSLPAWKTWRNGTSLVVCQVTNTNCDTAHDATCRSIISLYNAANNTAFSPTDQATYRNLALNMTADSLKYEVVQACAPSHLGFGPLCYWPASGASAKTGGVTSSYFTYNGYYPDGMIAFTEAYEETGNLTYAAVAGNISLVYLQAAYPNNYNWSSSGLRVPPGKALHWANFSTDAAPVCDDTCGTGNVGPSWDSEDANRALGYCEALYYMRRAGINNSASETYCQNLGNLYFNSTSCTPLQFYPNGTIVGNCVSGYQSLGLAALHQMGGSNQSLFGPTLDNALSHYSKNSHVWDSEACYGVYNHAFAVRALGEGIGRNLMSYPVNITTVGGGGGPSINLTNVSFLQGMVRSNDDPICTATTTYAGSQSTLSFSYNVLVNGVSVNNGTATGNPNSLVNVSTTSHTYLTRGATLACVVTATDGFQTSGPQNVTVTVGNARPVLQTATISNNGPVLTCGYTYTDNDNDTIQAAYYQWYVNNTRNASTQSLNTSLIPNNTSVLCQITINDGYDNSTPLNTSTAVVGDTTPPSLTNVIIPSSGTITSPVTLSLSCNDPAENLSQGSPSITWTDPNGHQNGPYTYNPVGGNNYQLVYQYNTIGTYTNFTVSCTDASGNTNTTNPTSTLAITLPSTGGGGSPGGPIVSTGPAACGFTVLQPVNGYLNAYCQPGFQSDSFTVTVHNDQGTTQSYNTSFNGVHCTVNTPVFSIPPQASQTITVSRCDCPTGNNDALQGSLVLQDQTCGNTVPIALYTNALSHLVNDPSTLTTFAVIVFVILALLISIVILARFVRT